MKPNRAWALQSFLVVFLMNSLLAGFIVLMACRTADGLSAWISPFAGPGAAALPDDVRSALAGLNITIADLQRYMMPVLVALAAAATFLLWLLVYLSGARQIRRTLGSVPAGPPVVENAPGPERADAADSSSEPAAQSKEKA